MPAVVSPFLPCYSMSLMWLLCVWVGNETEQEDAMVGGWFVYLFVF